MNKMYHINDRYFEDIDTEDKAYFFGFLCADGCNIIFENDKRHYRKIDFGLKLEDSYILKIFQKYLETKSKLSVFKSYNKKYNKTYEVIHLQISNNKMSKDLEKLGMIPRKSLTLKFPKINNKFKWHFIRGYFDGDGCISIDKYRENCYRALVKVCGSLEFCESLKNIIIKELNVKCSVGKQTKINTLNIHSNHGVYKFMSKIYAGANPELMLTRKYEKFIEFCDKTEKG